jgi:hypothetical protein
LCMYVCRQARRRAPLEAQVRRWMWCAAARTRSKSSDEEADGAGITGSCAALALRGNMHMQRLCADVLSGAVL